MSLHMTGMMVKWPDCAEVPQIANQAALTGSLPGHFSVWATSDEAKFLHGRFVAVHWDVDELKGSEMRQAIDEDYHFLTVGVIGVIGDK